MAQPARDWTMEEEWDWGRVPSRRARHPDHRMSARPRTAPASCNRSRSTLMAPQLSTHIQAAVPAREMPHSPPATPSAKSGQTGQSYKVNQLVFRENAGQLSSDQSVFVRYAGITKRIPLPPTDINMRTVKSLFLTAFSGSVDSTLLEPPFGRIFIQMPERSHALPLESSRQVTDQCVLELRELHPTVEQTPGLGDAHKESHLVKSGSTSTPHNLGNVRPVAASIPIPASHGPYRPGQGQSDPTATPSWAKTPTGSLFRERSVSYSQRQRETLEAAMSGLPTRTRLSLPTSSGQYQASQLSTASSQLPTASSQLPTASSQLPTASSQLPTASSQLPTASTQHQPSQIPTVSSQHQSNRLLSLSSHHQQSQLQISTSQHQQRQVAQPQDRTVQLPPRYDQHHITEPVDVMATPTTHSAVSSVMPSSPPAERDRLTAMEEKITLLTNLVASIAPNQRTRDDSRPPHEVRSYGQTSSDTTPVPTDTEERGGAVFATTRTKSGSSEDTPYLPAAVVAGLENARTQLRYVREELNTVKNAHQMMKEQQQQLLVGLEQRIRLAINTYEFMHAQGPASDKVKSPEVLHTGLSTEASELDAACSKATDEVSQLVTLVEEMRIDVLQHHCQVNMTEVDAISGAVTTASQTLTDLKGRAELITAGLKPILQAELETIVREEKFLKRWPKELKEHLEQLGQLTETLTTLKKLSAHHIRHNLQLPSYPTTADIDLAGSYQNLCESIKAVVPDHEERIHSLTVAEKAYHKKKQLASAHQINTFEGMLQDARSRLSATDNLAQISRERDQLLRHMFLNDFEKPSRGRKGSVSVLHAPSENSLVGSSSSGHTGSVQTVIVHLDSDEHAVHQPSSPLSMPSQPSSPPSARSQQTSPPAASLQAAVFNYAQQSQPTYQEQLPQYVQPPPYPCQQRTYNASLPFSDQARTNQVPLFNRHMAVPHHDTLFPHQVQDDGYFSQQSTLEARHHPAFSQSHLTSIV